MKQFIKNLLQRFCLRFGQKGHANTDPFFQCLLNIGFKPRHIIDVGAHMGGWTRTALQYFPDSHYSLFEPQRDLLESQIDLLKNPKIRFYFQGVGSKCEIRKMTTSSRRDSYSFQWSVDQARDLGSEQFEMEVVALDEFFVQDAILFPPADIVKIDAEGWDLEVLKGAEQTISHAEVVLLEAGVMNKSFKNTTREVINVMFNKGFVLFDITDLNRTSRDNALWNVELAFVRKAGKLEHAIDKYV
jgi:FkbM family methyltransferase